jgi:hypothetical protein
MPRILTMQAALALMPRSTQLVNNAITICSLSCEQWIWSCWVSWSFLHKLHGLPFCLWLW